MRTLMTGVCMMLLLPALALGQETDHKTAARGYGFISPGIGIGDGSTLSFLHIGGGVEARLYKGLGIGAELGYLAPVRYMSEGVGMHSFNGLYSFEKSSSKIAPFVTGGYSLLFRRCRLNAMNFGGGVDYWFRKKVGMRLEIRDNFSPRYLSDHLIQGRFGIVFR